MGWGFRTHGRKQMLISRIYEVIKSDLDSIRVNEVIVEYIELQGSIANAKMKELGGYTTWKTRLHRQDV